MFKQIEKIKNFFQRRKRMKEIRHLNAMVKDFQDKVFGSKLYPSQADIGDEEKANEYIQLAKQAKTDAELKKYVTLAQKEIAKLPYSFTFISEEEDPGYEWTKEEELEYERQIIENKLKSSIYSPYWVRNMLEHHREFINTIYDLINQNDIESVKNLYKEQTENYNGNVYLNKERG